jgi:hypothetical protein
MTWLVWAAFYGWEVADFNGDYYIAIRLMVIDGILEGT